MLTLRSDLWYKDAIVYSLNVETFMDSNGDGIGDFPGLIGRLDYLSALGVNCLWLLPFYPSPRQDNGYDIIDYYNVDPRFGTLGHFVEFLREARHRGMRVIIDLVVNHTSDQHPWFQSARKDPTSPYRNYYIWRDEAPEQVRLSQIVFTDEPNPWTYDEEANAYYFHRFYHFQPDLNTHHPPVQEEIQRIIGFWVELGVSGFRIDAAPYLAEQPALGRGGAETHQLLRDLRDFATSRRGDVALIAEADVQPEMLSDYFGEGHEMHLLFNFYVNSHLFLALAREDAGPITRAYHKLPSPPRVGQWLNWIRNHDELDVERLTEAEQEDVFEAFGPDPEMQVYGRGIRRRLPPMIAGDRRRMELAYSLLLSLPGTPMIRYGEEIGMGDDLSLPERWSVRTLMQWSSEANAGFSTAAADHLVRPVISDGSFRFQQVNVADQRKDPRSFLNWFERVIRVRRECPELGWGTFNSLKTDHPSVLAHTSEWNQRRVVMLHNLSNVTRSVSIEVWNTASQDLWELFSDQEYSTTSTDRPHLYLGPYGYRWFRVGSAL